MRLNFFGVIFSSWLLAGCNGIFFQPSRDYFRGPEQLGIYPTRIQYQSPDGLPLEGWYLPPAAQAGHRGQVIFLHGNAQNMSSHIHNVAWLPERGYGVLLVEYRGYGDNPGSPALKWVVPDADALLDAWQAQGLAEGPWYLLGQSLGASLAVYLSRHSLWQDGFCGLVLDAPFSSYRQIVREKLAAVWLTWPLQYPVSWLFDDSYAPERWIDSSPHPLLLIHSQDDWLIRDHHGRALFALHPGPKHWLPTRGPHTATFQQLEYRLALLDFLDRYPCQGAGMGDISN